MKEIGKVMAGICAFFFVLSGTAALMLFNIEQKVFSSETYKRAFQEQGLYAQTPVLIANILSEPDNNIGGTSILLSLLDTNQLALVISSLLPPAEIEAVTNSALDSAFAFINGESDSVRISLLSLKQNLAGEGGIRALTQVLQAQPDCTPEQVLQMGLGFLSSTSNLLMCNPPQEILQLVRPLIETQIQAIAFDIPDELTLVTAEQVNAFNFRTRLDRVRAIMKFSLLLPLSLLMALTLFAVRSLKDWLKWWGVPFIVTGFSTIFLALIGAPIVRFVIETVILQGSTYIPPVIFETLQNVFGSLARQVLIPVAVAGAILAFFGAGMIVVNFLMGRAVYLPSQRKT